MAPRPRASTSSSISSSSQEPLALDELSSDISDDDDLLFGLPPLQPRLMRGLASERRHPSSQESHIDCIDPLLHQQKMAEGHAESAGLRAELSQVNELLKEHKTRFSDLQQQLQQALDDIEVLTDMVVSNKSNECTTPALVKQQTTRRAKHLSRSHRNLLRDDPMAEKKRQASLILRQWKQRVELARAKEAEEAQEQAERECVVCYELGRSVVFLPCAHICVCLLCAERITQDATGNCPVCRCLITSFVRVFL